MVTVKYKQFNEEGERMRFNTYFLLTEMDVPEYIREKLDFFPSASVLRCLEIGDGNLNYVFRVFDEETNHSFIVKQAGPETRIKPDLGISTKRGMIEARILSLQNHLVEGFVPKVYLYDPVMCIIVMEDMKYHDMMRTGLLEHNTYPHFADHITTYLSNCLLRTSDLVMDHKEKKNLVCEYVNPELCEISENLVFTEPYHNLSGCNSIFPRNDAFIKREIYDDRRLHTEVAKLKYEFMNNAQALIHGDLHTGSIFVNQDHTYIFDPEFTFYGPMGFDIGNIVANIFFAWCHGDATIEDNNKRYEFCGWCLSTIKNIIDLFKDKFNQLYELYVTDVMARNPDFRSYYLRKVLENTAGSAGLELIRRVVGVAKVKDITSIENEQKRVYEERRCIYLAKELIFKRAKYLSGADYLETIGKVTSKVIFNKTVSAINNEFIDTLRS